MNPESYIVNREMAEAMAYAEKPYQEALVQLGGDVSLQPAIDHVRQGAEAAGLEARKDYLINVPSVTSYKIGSAEDFDAFFNKLEGAEIFTPSQRGVAKRTWNILRSVTDHTSYWNPAPLEFALKTEMIAQHRVTARDMARRPETHKDYSAFEPKSLRKTVEAINTEKYPGRYRGIGPLALKFLNAYVDDRVPKK